jgi:fructokinase
VTHAAGPLRIGVDLGGTKIEAVVLALRGDDACDVIVRERVPTHRDRGYPAIVTATSDLVRDVAARAGVELDEVPIGVGMPGGVRRRDGMVKNSNTTCLNGRPFRQDLQAAIGRRVTFDNDANCFALAEARVGAAAPYRDGVVFGVILGTGVGGGLVVRGRVWPGAQGIAGEWGHHAVFALPESASSPRPGDEPRFEPLRACYCGNRGCVEPYVSGTAVELDYERRAGVRRAMRDIVDRRGRDPHADAALSLFLDAFARGMANVIDILDPSAIVLGGGLSNVPWLYDEGVERIARYVFNDELATPVLANALGDSAGVIGAALLE